jgi:hypothetical protein
VRLFVRLLAGSQASPLPRSNAVKGRVRQSVNGGWDGSQSIMVRSSELQRHQINKFINKLLALFDSEVRKRAILTFASAFCSLSREC